MTHHLYKPIIEELAAAIWYSMDSKFLTGIEWDYLTEQERENYRTVAESIWGSNEHFIPDEIFAEPDLSFVQEMVYNFDFSDTGDVLEDIVSDVAKFVCGISTKRDEQSVRFETPSDEINKELVDDIRSWIRAFDEVFYDSIHNTDFPRAGTIKPIAPATNSPDTSGFVKLSVNLNAETAEALKSMSSSMEINYTETIRRAIALLNFINDEKENDRIIRTMDQNGKKVREITITN